MTIEATTPGARPRARVLVVDDEPMVFATLKILLEERWEMLYANSAAAARELLGRTPVDVILSDNRMPGEDGISLLAWAYAKHPGTIRILMTGYSDVEAIIAAVNSGHIWHYIAKPWKNDLLVNLIQKGLDYRASRVALERSERVYRELFHNAHVGIVRMDCEWRLEEANRAFGASLGASVLEELVDVPFGSLFVDPASFEQLRERLERDWSIDNVEIVLQDRTERPIHLLLNASMRQLAGRQRAIEASTLDLTAQRLALRESDELRSQLQRLQRHEALGSFAGGILHDFNNMLSVMSSSVSYAQMLVGDHETGERWTAELSEALEDIHTATSAGVELSRQLLTTLREGGTERVSIDLNSIGSRVTRLVERGYGPRYRYEVRLAPALPPVRANAGQIHQCLLNLCLNACEAMDEGGTLTLETYAARDGESVDVRVRDTGTGMTDDVLAKIWNPFFTTKAGSTEGGGSGLGLSMVRAIVEQHEGSLDVESTPGEGSCFTLRIPCGRGASARPASRDRSSLRPEGSATVLLVDDDLAIQRQAARGLGKLGFRVITCGTGRGAVEVVTARPEIDIVILDVVLPAMTGAEAFERIRAIRPGVPVLFATGHVTSDGVREALRAGRVGLLTKPYTVDELAGAVADLLAKQAS